MPEYSCRVTLRTANWEVSFENVARIDFTWFSYCQNTSPVFNAPIRRELDAEKVRWDNHVRECLRMLTTLQLVTEDPESVPEINPVNLLHHTIASLGALSLSITRSRRVAVDKRLEVD